MSTTHPSRIIGSYRHSWTTGAVTTIAAGSATAGHILALRYATADRAALIKSLEVSFLLTTAFTAAQRVGYDAVIARTYTAAHSGATALTMTGGGKNAGFNAPALTGRIADAGALTAGTHTFDANPICKESFWCGAVGAKMGPTLNDFSASEQKGILLQNNEGLVVRNVTLMGAAGVGEWVFTCEWDEVEI